MCSLERLPAPFPSVRPVSRLFPEFSDGSQRLLMVVDSLRSVVLRESGSVCGTILNVSDHTRAFFWMRVHLNIPTSSNETSVASQDGDAMRNA